MDDIVIAVGLAFGFLLLFMGATGSKKESPPPKRQKHEHEPVRKMRVDAIADAAHSLDEAEEVELIRAIARDLKRKRHKRKPPKKSQWPKF